MDLGEAGMDGKKVKKKYLLRYSLPQPLGTNPTHSPRQYAANSTQVMMQEQAWVTLPPPFPRLTLSSLNTPPPPSLNPSSWTDMAPTRPGSRLGILRWRPDSDYLQEL